MVDGRKKLIPLPTDREYSETMIFCQGQHAFSLLSTPVSDAIGGSLIESIDKGKHDDTTVDSSGALWNAKLLICGDFFLRPASTTVSKHAELSCAMASCYNISISGKFCLPGLAHTPPDFSNLRRVLALKNK